MVITVKEEHENESLGEREKGRRGGEIERGVCAKATSSPRFVVLSTATLPDTQH